MSKLTPEEFAAKLANAPQDAASASERKILAEYDKEKAAGRLDLTDLDYKEYSGKLMLRLPRSLHKELAEAARIEGVSLNQYALYKLSKE